MEIMVHIKNVVKNKKSLLYYVYFLLPGFGLAAYIVSGHCFQQYEYITMLKYIVSPFALVLTIYIWFFVVPNYIKEIYDLKNAFNYNKEYNALYDKFIQWINQFNLEYGVKSSGVKIVFLLSWIGFGFVFVYYVDYEIIPDGGMGNIFMSGVRAYGFKLFQLLYLYGFYIFYKKCF